MDRIDIYNEISLLIRDLCLVPSCTWTSSDEFELQERLKTNALTGIEKELIDDKLKALNIMNHSRKNSRYKNYDLCVQVPSLFDNMV